MFGILQMSRKILFLQAPEIHWKANVLSLIHILLLRKYSMLTGRGNPLEQRPVVVSTSSIALQKAILTEYIPFLSRVLLEQGIIQSPLRAVVRKGKEHFVCDNRLEQRIEAIRHKQKNAAQKEALSVSYTHLFRCGKFQK